MRLVELRYYSNNEDLHISGSQQLYERVCIVIAGSIFAVGNDNDCSSDRGVGRFVLRGGFEGDIYRVNNCALTHLDSKVLELVE